MTSDQNLTGSRPGARKGARLPGPLRVRTAVLGFLKGYFSTCRRSPKTFAAYELDLRQFCLGRSSSATIGAISPETIEAWVSKLTAQGMAAASVRRKIATLRVFFRYLVRRGSLTHSPLSQLRFDLARERPLTRALDRRDVDALLLAARRLVREPGQSPEGRLRQLRNHALVAILFTTGLRVGELAGVSLSSVDLREAAIRVQGKGGRERIAFLVDRESNTALRRYLHVRLREHASTDALFLNRLGGRLSTQGIANVLSDLATAAGLARHITPHMLRHTVATLLLRNGADLRLVQEFLGHASIVTTQRYTHVAKEHLLEGLRVTHPTLRRPPHRAPLRASIGSSMSPIAAAQK